MKIPRQTFRHLWARMLALVLLSVTAASAAAQTNAREALVVYMTDGAKVSYFLETKPTVRFNNATMLIESTQLSDSHDMAKVANFRFEEVGTEQPPSGVSETAVEYRIVVTASAVTVSGMEPGTTVAAADMQGRVLASVQADSAGSATIQTRNFAPGVYVIATADRHSFKIYKR